jgi:glycosyltransferase involved in cell wall biosynthesis
MEILDLKKYREMPLPSEANIISLWDKKAPVPVISIVCIAYNHRAYLHDAIKGFLIQKTEYPFEIIIHDDASTDDSQDIIKFYQEKYPKIVKPIFQIENQFSKDPNSLASIPIKVSKGRYIALCEGDDFWIEPFKLQRQVSYLEKNPDFSMCIHNAVIFDQYEVDQYFFNKKKLPSFLTVKDVITRSWFSPTASFLFRNKVINIPVNQDSNGDMLILFLNSLYGKIYYSNEVMSVYNYGAINSLSDVSREKKLNLYSKKLKFLEYVNNKTKYRYFLYTCFKMVKIKIAVFLLLSGLRK